MLIFKTEFQGGRMANMDPPAGLGARGVAFWSAVTARYGLSDSEVEILTEACRTLDDLDRLADGVAEHGAMVVGSMGQPVVNPALTELRGQRAVLHRLIAALQLPDDTGAVVPSSGSLR